MQFLDLAIHTLLESYPAIFLFVQQELHDFDHDSSILQSQLKWTVQLDCLVSDLLFGSVN